MPEKNLTRTEAGVIDKVVANKVNDNLMIAFIVTVTDMKKVTSADFLYSAPYNY